MNVKTTVDRLDLPQIFVKFNLNMLEIPACVDIKCSLYFSAAFADNLEILNMACEKTLFKFTKKILTEFKLTNAARKMTCLFAHHAWTTNAVIGLAVDFVLC